MPVRRAMTVLALAAATLTTACASLLGADATPVPGAAATLTRSERTPIPTLPRTPSAAASPSASAARPAGSASPVASPTSSSQVIGDDEVARMQGRMEQVTGSRDLPGIESVLLDHVSLSTVQGGSVLDASQSAAWLRDHAGSGIKVTNVERGTQTLMLQVQTDGWPARDPVSQGQVSFSLRRYDANGRPDEDKGDWKIDVIDAE